MPAPTVAVRAAAAARASAVTAAAGPRRGLGFMGSHLGWGTVGTEQRLRALSPIGTVERPGRGVNAFGSFNPRTRKA
ncbi:hypothetical protein GCM10010441_71040 [Kitasatospora paracochleata]